MDRAYGLPGNTQDEARLTLDEEATLGAADYLRGWLLAAQLRAALIRKVGVRWWENPDAGAFLKPLLAPGNAVDADGLARALGDAGVAPDAFVAAVLPRLPGAGADATAPAPAQPGPAAAPPAAAPGAAEPAPAREAGTREAGGS